jgi:hypothetical protein
MKKLLSIGSIAVSSIALNFLSFGQALAVNLVQNGGFAQNNVTGDSAYLGNTTNDITVSGWTFGAFHGSGPSNNDNGYNFIIKDGTNINTTGMAAQGNAPYGSTTLYTDPGQVVNSADGSGWYIAADAWFGNASISQTLTGLSTGTQYTVNFSQAAGQQVGYAYKGGDDMSWQVGFGNSTQKSTMMTVIPGQSVSAWTPQSLTFTADGSTQLLSFLAEGTQDVPPFALLSGVSVEAVNEEVRRTGTGLITIDPVFFLTIDRQISQQSFSSLEGVLFS